MDTRRRHSNLSASQITRYLKRTRSSTGHRPLRQANKLRAAKAEPVRLDPPLADMLLGLDDETLDQLFNDLLDNVLEEFDPLPDEEYERMINDVLQEFDDEDDMVLHSWSNQVLQESNMLPDMQFDDRQECNRVMEYPLLDEMREYDPLLHLPLSGDLSLPHDALTLWMKLLTAVRCEHVR